LSEVVQEAAREERAKLAWWHGAALLLATAYVLVVELDATPYDDSFFFKRFALHALGGHGFSWNVADGPVYGLTSQLFAGIVVLLTRLFPDHVVVASKVSLAAYSAGLAAFLLRFAARRGVPSSSAGLLVLLALGTPLTLLEPHTGMETSLCLTMLALALTAIVRGDGSTAHAVLSAALTALVYSCRPDAALIPALTFLIAERRNARALACYGAVTSALLAGFLCACKVYYGTALPLPFYAKTAGFSRYDQEMRAAGLPDKVRHALTFCAFSAPLVWVALRGRDARVWALLVAAAAFALYQAFITDEIMGYRARFYAPAIAALAVAALLAWHSCRQRSGARSAFGAWATWAVLLGTAYAAGGVERGSDSVLDRLPWTAYVAQLSWGVLLCDRVSKAPKLSARLATNASIGVLVLGTLALCAPQIENVALDDATFLRRASAEVTTTRGLFEVARCISRPQTLYHSEIGVPGLVLPDWRIVDLVGLMSTELALHRPPFDDYCLRDRPAVLFLPHKVYRTLNAEIRASTCIHDYTLMVRESSSPLYVRNDLSDAFNRCRTDPWRMH
jgi:hypothetical protein